MSPFSKLLTFLGVLALALCRVAPPAAAADVEETEKAGTIVQMRKVWDALMAFKKDGGQYPGELSELVPRYLPDADALISATEKRTGRHGDNGQIDVKSRTSFCYEFTSRKFNRSALSFRELKERQMEEFGPVVPLLRCFLYGRVLNLSVSGDIFESALYWESSPGAKAVMDRIGLGPGFKDGESATLTVKDNKTGNAVSGAEVRVTRRQYHGLPLPDRTLRTAVDGTARVPLGPADAPSRKLTVTVFEPGFFAPSQAWEDGRLPKEVTVGLDEGAVLGGFVRTLDGKPLQGASVRVLHMRPDEKNAGKFTETPLSEETTDAEGRWKCGRVPREFVGIAMEVRHDAAWTSWFYSSRETGPHMVLRGELLAASAELSVPPAAALRGTVLDAAGKPVPGADVSVKWTSANPPHLGGLNSLAKTIPPAPAPVKTDAAGRFAFPWHDHGEITVTAFPDAAPPAREQVTAAPDMKEQELRLAAGRIIKGRITDDAGKAVSGAEIRCYSWGGVTLSDRKSVAKTDASGAFVWGTAPPDTVRIVISAEGFTDLYHTVPDASEAAEGTPEIALKLRARTRPAP